MRRALAGLLLTLLLLAGCGSTRPTAPADPLGSALSYLPLASPLAIEIQTGTHSEIAQALAAIDARFPIATLGQNAALAKLQALGINYRTDVRPLLGNPIVFAGTGGPVRDFGQHFLVAWVTHSAQRLSALLRKLHGLSRTGRHDGATLYALGGSGALAVDGPTVLLARSAADVTAALDRHAHGGGLTSAQHTADVQGLDGQAAIQVFGDLQAILNTPGAARARRDPWVGALRTYGVTMSFARAGLTLAFRLGTDPGSVTTAQLPIAAGSTSPGLVSGLPVQAGIHDPARIVNFVLDAIQAVSPHRYAGVLRELATAKRKTGVDVRALASQLNGDLVVGSDTHTTLVRADVSDPQAVAAALTKLAGARGALGHGSRLRRLGPDRFAVQSPQRRTLIALVGRTLIVGVPPKGGSLTGSALVGFAHAASAPLAGASGAVTFRIAINQLLALTTPQAAQSPMARQILGLLGDLTGSVSATTSALTGRATLAFR
ncbi:MAG TPA: hypothetical protein VFN55_03920 [Solirubrobacteraceae bacterium]|nr:hypothetical protein [Solirubrobacteraceae bacterium]